MFDKNTCCFFIVESNPTVSTWKLHRIEYKYQFNVSGVSLKVKPPYFLAGFLQSSPFFLYMVMMCKCLKMETLHVE